MPFNKDVSDHFYELGLDLLFLGYSREDVELWMNKQKKMSLMKNVMVYLEH